jgi:hypothetical protein
MGLIVGMVTNTVDLAVATLNVYILLGKNTLQPTKSLLSCIM